MAGAMSDETGNFPGNNGGRDVFFTFCDFNGYGECGAAQPLPEGEGLYAIP